MNIKDSVKNMSTTTKTHIAASIALAILIIFVITCALNPNILLITIVVSTFCAVNWLVYNLLRCVYHAAYDFLEKFFK